MATGTTWRVGVLYDFPQGDGGEYFEHALRLGLAEAPRRGVDTVELVRRHAEGHPRGSAEDVVAALRDLAGEGVVCVVGPSISDNCLAARDAADAIRLPAVNYSGGEQTRSEWMLHYQVGSLAEEPPLLAERLAARGLSRPAVVHDESVVGRSYLEHFRHAAARHHLEVPGVEVLAPTAEDARPQLEALRATHPDALVYLGLGASSRAVALGRADAGWEVPVLSNSALMFGYARPDWRDGYRGWEYVDNIADDNPVRAALRERSRAAAAGPIGCAAYDIGRLVGEALGRAEDSTPRAVRDGLLAVKWLPAASGHAGTMMGFGVWDHAALKGRYLVLREWRDGRSVQVV